MKNLLAKIKPLEKKKPSILKEAAEKAMKRLYPNIKLSEEKLDNIVDRLRKNAAVNTRRTDKSVLNKLKQRLFGKKAPLQSREFFSGTDFVPGGASNNDTSVKGVARELLARLKGKAEQIPGAFDRNIGNPAANIANELLGDAPARMRQSVGKGIASAFNPISEGVSNRYNAAKNRIKKEYGDYRDIFTKAVPPRPPVPSPAQGVEKGLSPDLTPTSGKEKAIGGMDDYYKNLYKNVSGE